MEQKVTIAADFTNTWSMSQGV